MTTFLFWNVFKKDLTERLARLIETHQVDVLVIAESPVGAVELASAISSAGGPQLTPHGWVEAKVKVLSRFHERAIRGRYTDPLGRLSIYQAILPAMSEILLAVAHLPSRVNCSKEGLNQLATRWAGQIRRTEGQVGHQRTVLVGDLNLNPFDDGLVSGEGFHAVMTRKKAEEGSRLIAGERSPFFYNPMWGFFGDRTPGPPGSYYLSGTDPINYF